MPTINENISLKGFSTAEARWARFGPYYAMFPIDFAFDVVREFSNPGEYIIDPFAGRCSSIYAGGVMGRPSTGIEINPVGWLYGSVKLNPAKKSNVLKRLSDIDSKKRYFGRSAEALPEFFQMCFCENVLKFLLSARKNLKWKSSRIDRTLMSIILVYLHGKIGEGLSNQMRMTKAMGPSYSIKWWRENGYKQPPEIDAADVIRKKISWRYEKGSPKISDSKVIFGDSTEKLRTVVHSANRSKRKYSLLFTSPPYCDVTDYHADQWLRLWLLGGPSHPTSLGQINKGRFIGRSNYYQLLDSVFGQSSNLMSKKSAIYVRTDRRNFTFETTLEILSKHFPHHDVRTIDQPYQQRTQTELHGNSSTESGEIDILLVR